jgi:hypothetical protein
VVPTATTCEALPVLQLDYNLNTSVLNEVKGGARTTVTLNGSRGGGYTGNSDVAGATFSVSYDDGATWTPVETRRRNANSFTATFSNAELADSNGFVAFKSEIWDSTGNRTVHTIDRAYSLK